MMKHPNSPGRDTNDIKKNIAEFRKTIEMQKLKSLRTWFSINRIIKWLPLTLIVISLFSQHSVYAQTLRADLPSITLNQPAINNIYGTDWSPDGKLLAVATNSGVWIFTPTLKEVAHLTIPAQLIYGVDWNPDGTKLAGAGVDGIVHIWNMKDLSVLAELPDTGVVADVKWSPNLASDQIAALIIEKLDFFLSLSIYILL